MSSNFSSHSSCLLVHKAPPLCPHHYFFCDYPLPKQHRNQCHPPYSHFLLPPLCSPYPPAPPRHRLLTPLSPALLPHRYHKELALPRKSGRGYRNKFRILTLCR